MSRLLGLKIEEEFFKLSPKLIKNREKAPFDGWVNGQHIEFKTGRNNTITFSDLEILDYENGIYNPLIIQAYTKLINDQYHITITNNFMATDLLKHGLEPSIYDDSWFYPVRHNIFNEYPMSGNDKTICSLIGF